jgi:Holliday junction resolvase RusA-like endonuclease
VTQAATLVILRLSIDGEPVPKSRPRFNRKTGHAYTPEATRAAENAIGWRIRQAYPGLEADGDSAWSVCADFYCGKRSDLDNLLKGLLDGAQGVVFQNDDQVAHIEARRYRFPSRPHMDLIFTKLGAT